MLNEYSVSPIKLFDHLENYYHWAHSLFIKTNITQLTEINFFSLNFRFSQKNTIKSKPTKLPKVYESGSERLVTSKDLAKDHLQ